MAVQERLLDTQPVTRSVPLEEADPRLIAKSIAPVPAPPTKEIFAEKKRHSRFEMQKKTIKNDVT